MTVAIICGGRSYGLVPPDIAEEVRQQAQAVAARERARLNHILDAAVERLDVRYLAVGDATGADALAASWAEDRAMPFKVWPADWATRGKAAGPIRNAAMLAESEAEVVIAFPGSKGTRNMCSLATKAGVRVIKVDWT